MSSPATVHNFPPDYPPDTKYLRAALDEWNYRERTLNELPQLRYDELSPSECMQVLRRARELKLAERERFLNWLQTVDNQ